MKKIGKDNPYELYQSINQFQNCLPIQSIYPIQWVFFLYTVYIYIYIDFWMLFPYYFVNKCPGKMYICTNVQMKILT